MREKIEEPQPSLTVEDETRVTEKAEQEPLETKEWPWYIEERWRGLNAVETGTLSEQINTLLSYKEKDPLLFKPLLLSFSVRIEKGLPEEQRTENEQEILASFLEKLAGDEDRGVRKAAAQGLGNLGEKALPVLEKLVEDERWDVRWAAAQSLGELGEKALPVLEKLAGDKNWSVRWAAAQGLGNLGEKALPILEKLAGDEDWSVRRAAIQSLGKLGEKALPVLEKLAEDEDRYVRKAAAQSLGNLGEKALPGLEKLAEDEHGYVRWAAAQGLGNLGEKALPILKKLAENEDRGVRKAAAQGLGNLGEKALPVLEKLVEDERWDVRWAAAQSMGKVGEKALPVLEKLAGDKNSGIRRAAALAIQDIKKSKTLLKIDKIDKAELVKLLISSQEPCLLTPLVREIYEPTKETESPLLKLNDMAAEIKTKYPMLVGLTVLGSFSKGYWQAGSDLDWCLIFQNNRETPIPQETIKEIKTAFRSKAEKNGFQLCQDHSFDFSRFTTPVSEQDYNGISNIFNGLFVGDRKKMKEAQKAILQGLTHQQWEEVRKSWLKHLSEYSKMQERFGLSKKQVNEIINKRSFLWSPADLATMRKTFESQHPEKT